MISLDGQIIPFFQSDRQNLEKSYGAWIAKNFEMYSLLSRLIDGSRLNKPIPCSLLIRGLRHEFNHHCACKYTNT